MGYVMAEENTKSTGQNKDSGRRISDKSSSMFDDSKMLSKDEGVESKQVASKEVKKEPSKKNKALTTRQAIRKVYKNAPAALLNQTEDLIGSDTLDGLRKMNPDTVANNINVSIDMYANDVIIGNEKLTKTLERELRGYAERNNLNYDSLFTIRGMYALADAIREETGNVTLDTILNASDE